MNQQQRWLVNAALLIGFLVCFFLDLTGVALHQWLGIAGGVLAGYHLITHWSWVKAVIARFFGKTSSQARLYMLLDGIIAAGFVVMLVTGVVISTWLNLSLANYNAWHSLHVLSAVYTLLAVTIKIGLHARMIIAAARRIVKKQPVPLTPAANRRAFFKLMGVVGTASLVALGSAMIGLSTSANAENSTAGSGAAASDGSSSSSSTCAIRCNRRCAYPGHCRRYVDSNGSGRCDLGECQA